MKLTTNSLYNSLLDETHLLIAGTTGSGKSTLLNDLIYTAQFRHNMSLILIDPKRVEFMKWYNNQKVCRYITEPEDILDTLKDIEEVMDKRFIEMMEQGEIIYSKNDIYVIVDELADLMTFDNSKEIKKVLSRIGRLGRASRIHLILATQNPSRSKTGGLPPEIIQNMTASVALRCRSAIESRQIIGINGAEKLPRYGKCIVWNAEGYKRYDLIPTDKEMLEEVINNTKE